MTANFRYDEAILSGPRLSILGALISGDAVDFTFLQKNLGIADGNLSSHLRRLETERYISTEKAFVRGKPKTFFSITQEGRNALARLLRQLEDLLGQGLEVVPANIREESPATDLKPCPT